MCSGAATKVAEYMMDKWVFVSRQKYKYFS